MAAIRFPSKLDQMDAKVQAQDILSDLFDMLWL